MACFKGKSSWNQALFKTSFLVALYILATAFPSLFWAKTSRAVLKCLSKHMVCVLFPTLTTQAAGNGALAWKHCRNGVSVTWSAGLVIQTLDVLSCWVISEQSQKLNIISPKYLRHTLPTDSLHDWFDFLLLEIPIHKTKHSYQALPTAV